MGDPLAGKAEVVHADDSPDRIDDLEVDDRVDRDGDVVLRDHGLGRDVHDLDPEVDPHDLVADRDPEEDAGKRASTLTRPKRKKTARWYSGMTTNTPTSQRRPDGVHNPRRC